jgi:hypothetical protein
LTYVRACLRDRGRKCQERHFAWKLFYEPVPGQEAVQKKEDCHPVAILAGHAVDIPIELESPKDQRDLLLAAEAMTLVIEIWVNRSSLAQSFDTSVEGTFSTEKTQVEYALKSPTPRVCRYRRAEWNEATG